MRSALILLFLFALSAASDPDLLLSGGAEEPRDVILEQLNEIALILIPLMLTMVAMAVAAYVIGQMFGSETRAKATQWAHGMLAAVGVSAIVLLFLNVVVPWMMTGGPAEGSIEGYIIQVRGITETALAGLIAIFIVLSAAFYAAGQVMGAQTRAKATVWATGLLTAAIVASVIYIFLFQILTQFESAFFTGTILSPYNRVLINITFFVSFIILITYMLSKVFKIPEWEAYLNIELSNLLNSFTVVLFVIGMFAVGEAVSIAQFGGESPVDGALTFMRDKVAESVIRGIFDIYQIQACTSMMSTVSRRIGEFVLTQTYKVFPGIDTFVSISNVLGFGMVSVYGSISAQIALLYFVNATMVPFFLPAGLILRFFPPTRDAGAFLIAFAFGFQIIFPMTYLINEQVLSEIFPEMYDKPYDTPATLIASICGPFKFGVYGVVFNPGVNPLFGYLPGGGVIGTFLARLFSEHLLNYITMDEFIVVMQHISRLSLLSLFMPALSMLITIAFINAMAKFLVAKV